MRFKQIPPTGHKIYYKDCVSNTDLFQFTYPAYWLNSGTSALYFLLITLDMAPDSAVFVPAYTCPSVVTAVLMSGYKPILVDVNPQTLNYDENDLTEKLYRYEPGAVIWVNLFGLNDQIPELEIPIILDNAQSDNFTNIPISVAGQVLSFGRGKPVNTLGGGIALVNKTDNFKGLETTYNNVKPASRSESLKYILQLLFYKIFYHPNLYGMPYKIPWLHLGETIFQEDVPVNLPVKLNRRVIQNIFNRYSEIREMRKKVCEFYVDILESYQDKIHFFKKYNFYRFPLLMKDTRDRGRLLNGLQKIGIGATGLYPFPLNRQPGLDEILNGSTLYQGAEYVSKNLLTLPVNEFVDKKVIENIDAIFRKVLK